MAALTEPLIFQHYPLPDAKTHIRLLKVLSVAKTRAIPVYCELTTFSIAEAPPYHAISYTWGNPAPLSLILVNGQQMNVRLNCAHALRQTSQHIGTGAGECLLWIDSICVNQLDNEEKGTQVAMMGEIFKTAKKVLACVGAHGDDSEFLYEFLRGEEARNQSVLLSHTSDSQEPGFPEDLELSRNELRTWRRKYPRSILIRMYKAITNFLARPYFHRVWIYQELFLGRDISVYCGDDALPISWIWVTISFVEAWLQGTIGWRLGLSTLHPDMWHTLVNFQKSMPLLLASAREDQPLMRFSATITPVAELSCQDPRDSIYGILSIVESVENHHIQPDYTKDRFDLAVEVLQKTRAETFASGFDFDTSVASYAKSIGLNLNLRDSPSQKLIAARELRRSATNLQEVVPNVIGTRGEKNSTAFVGSRILLQQEEWRLEHQGNWFLRHGPTFKNLKIKKRLRSDEIPSGSVGVYLPPEAQDGDWLLIPRSHGWMRQTRYPWNRVAILARHHDSEKFEIVGKVLISSKGWVSKWAKTKKGPSAFRVYCDPEDLLVLFDLCKWDDLAIIAKWEDSEAYDVYFRTRFCGTRFSSYAVRMKT